MNRRLIIILAMFAVGVSTAPASDSHIFMYELRVPKTAKFEPSTTFNVVTDVSISSGPLSQTERRQEGNVVIFAGSKRIFDGEQRRAMVVKTEGQPSQVFRLAIPRKPKATDWTSWQKPDYIEKTNAEWTFMQDLKEHDRSTNIPPDCFELRFRITERRSSHFPYLIPTVVLGLSCLIIVVTVGRLIRCRSRWAWWMGVGCASILGLWVGRGVIAYKISESKIAIGFPLRFAMRAKDGDHWMDFPLMDQTLLRYIYYTDIVAIVAMLLVPILLLSLFIQRKPPTAQPTPPANPD